MSDSNYAVEMISGMPVVTAPADIDTTTADQLRMVLMQAASRIFTLTSLYRFIPRFDSRPEALLQRPAAPIESASCADAGR